MLFTRNSLGIGYEPVKMKCREIYYVNMYQKKTGVPIINIRSRRLQSEDNSSGQRGSL